MKCTECKAHVEGYKGAHKLSCSQSSVQRIELHVTGPATAEGSLAGATVSDPIPNNRVKEVLAAREVLASASAPTVDIDKARSCLEFLRATAHGNDYANEHDIRQRYDVLDDALDDLERRCASPQPPPVEEWEEQYITAVEELRKTLGIIRTWDMLSPGTLNDGPYFCKLIDDTLECTALRQGQVSSNPQPTYTAEQYEGMQGERDIAWKAYDDLKAERATGSASPDVHDIMLAALEEAGWSCSCGEPRLRGKPCVECRMRKVIGAPLPEWSDEASPCAGPTREEALAWAVASPMPEAETPSK